MTETQEEKNTEYKPFSRKDVTERINGEPSLERRVNNSRNELSVLEVGNNYENLIFINREYAALTYLDNLAKTHPELDITALYAGLSSKIVDLDVAAYCRQKAGREFFPALYQ